MSIFVATDVYALFKKFFKIICNIHVLNEGGGGVKGRLNNVKKNAQLAHVGFPKVTRPQEYIQCVTLSMEMLTSRPVIKIALETKLCVMSQ